MRQGKLLSRTELLHTFKRTAVGFGHSTVLPAMCYQGHHAEVANTTPKSHTHTLTLTHTLTHTLSLSWSLSLTHTLTVTHVTCTHTRTYCHLIRISNRDICEASKKNKERDAKICRNTGKQTSYSKALSGCKKGRESIATYTRVASES